MEEIGPTKRAIQRLISRYPDRTSAIRNAALRNLTFREICEDLAIALETLAEFEARPDAANCPEIAEYKMLISELEAEVGSYLVSGVDP